jgi:hypothetical protein
MNSDRDIAERSVVVSRAHPELYDAREVCEVFYKQVARIGLKAALLARALRKKYGQTAGRDDTIFSVISALLEETDSTKNVGLLASWARRLRWVWLHSI